jgi:hypothetical protein
LGLCAKRRGILSPSFPPASFTLLRKGGSETMKQSQVMLEIKEDEVLDIAYVYVNGYVEDDAHFLYLIQYLIQMFRERCEKIGLDFYPIILDAIGAGQYSQAMDILGVLGIVPENWREEL